MAAYVAAKQRIYRNCGLAVAHRGEPETYPGVDCPVTSFGADRPKSDEWGILETDEGRMLSFGEQTVVASRLLPIAGVHNELNFLAAMALADGEITIRYRPSVFEGEIGDGVVLHAGVRLYPGVRIGAGSVLHANCVIRERCIVGCRVLINANATIAVVARRLLLRQMYFRRR